jgi:hypothetical protein
MPEEAKEEPKSGPLPLPDSAKVLSTGMEPEKKEPKVIQEVQQEFKHLHPKRRDKVCILGFTATKELAPFQDTSYEMWGCNELYAQVPRIDVIFELHSRKEWGADCGSNYKMEHVQNLRKMPIPVYMAEKYPDIPNSIAYPWEEIFEAFPFGSYLTNSISEMIALAIYMKYKEIGVFGIEMAHHTEFPTQRPSVEYWLGIAVGMYKIQGWPKVVLPRQSHLLSTHYVYGKDNEDKWIQELENHQMHYAGEVNKYALEELKNRDTKNQSLGVQMFIDFLRRNRVMGKGYNG